MGVILIFVVTLLEYFAHPKFAGHALPTTPTRTSRDYDRFHYALFCTLGSDLPQHLQTHRPISSAMPDKDDELDEKQLRAIEGLSDRNTAPDEVDVVAPEDLEAPPAGVLEG